MPTPIPYPLTLAWLTDFGLNDAYVGMMKAVALSMLTPQARPWVTLLDVTHGIEAHNVTLGAWQLVQGWPTLPINTVLVAVVDPAVGQAQQGYLLAYKPSHQQYVLAPNNGLLAPLLAEGGWLVRAITATHLGWPNKPAHQGHTFAGRDLLTPVAVHLLNAWVANRLPELLPTVGEVTTTWQPLALPQATPTPYGSWHAQAWHTDSFGNVVTSLSLAQRPFEPSAQGAYVTLLWPEGQQCRLPLAGDYGQPMGSVSSPLRLVAASHGYWELAAPCQPVQSVWPLPPELLTTPFEWVEG
jgi:S-adenosylmethionine hydrolase